MISESEWQRHITLQKSIAWENAKGALRSVIAIQGNTYGSGAGSESMEYYDKVKKRIESFIKKFEEDGLKD